MCGSMIKRSDLTTKLKYWKPAIFIISSVSDATARRAQSGQRPNIAGIAGFGLELFRLSPEKLAIAVLAGSVTHN